MGRVYYIAYINLILLNLFTHVIIINKRVFASFLTSLLTFLLAYRTFEWKYVIGVYEDTSYGVEGFHEIVEHAKQADICIAETYKINR